MLLSTKQLIETLRYTQHLVHSILTVQPLSSHKEGDLSLGQCEGIVCSWALTDGAGKVHDVHTALKNINAEA